MCWLWIFYFVIITIMCFWKLEFSFVEEQKRFFSSLYFLINVIFHDKCHISWSMSYFMINVIFPDQCHISWSMSYILINVIFPDQSHYISWSIPLYFLINPIFFPDQCPMPIMKLSFWRVSCIDVRLLNYNQDRTRS